MFIHSVMTPKMDIDDLFALCRRLLVQLSYSCVLLLFACFSVLCTSSAAYNRVL